MNFSNAVVKLRIPIIIIIVLLLIPSVFGMISTRVNYDMLTYLPEDIETVKGQNELLDEFEKGAFTFIIFEDMSDEDVVKLENKIAKIDHVDTVLSANKLEKMAILLGLPIELMPAELFGLFKSENASMIAVFFDTTTSADATMEAVEEIRSACGKQCFVSGLTALVVDLKNLCEEEEPIYVGLAVILALAVMTLLLDNYLIPFVFLGSIGVMILLNLGSNYFFGEISYITKALSAVLQLAVTMDYSIFLWHSYNAKCETESDRKTAMAKAIRETLSAVIGSSVTTIAGFAALCFMAFTLGRDLGIVMAKGVLLGVIGCVTFLPSLILVLDKPLRKTHHKPLIPDIKKFSAKIVKIFPVFLIVFVIITIPAYYGYSEANDEVYYDIGQCLPQDINFVIANSKLRDEFDIATTHMVLADADLPTETVAQMVSEMEKVEGIKHLISLESVLGTKVPTEAVPDALKGMLRSENYELILINSVYRVASDEVNAQIDELESIMKKYDPKGMLIGEAPCTKDLIETADHDFRVVTFISVIAIFIIILLVEKSLSLPFILIAIIEVGIFINLGLPHYLGQNMAFITPICISTIQLGATVDYAILMTTRYKSERIGGKNKYDAVHTALHTSFPSIIVSGFGLFAATVGVAIYSDIEIISSMCMLLARGALLSMLLVLFVLPAAFMLFDKIICKTTLGMTKIK